MIAGDTLGATALTTRLVARFGPTSQNTVEDVALEAKSIYEELRREAINTEIFHPRGFTMDQFYQGGLQGSLQPHLVGGIDNEVMTYDYGVELVVAGTDKSGAHIFAVGNPGTVSNYQDIGYVAIGSGGIHATQSLIGFKHSGFHSLFETLFTVYASKRRAEAAPGVGPETDLLIIPPLDGGPWVWLTLAQLDKLDSLYKKFSQPLGHEIAMMVGELNLFGEQENESQTKASEHSAIDTAESASAAVQPEEDVRAE